VLKLDWNLLFTLINLVVFYFLMRKFLFGPIMNIMEERKKTIEEGFSKARTDQAEAMELKEHYKAALSGAREESRKIVAEAKENAQAEYNRILKDADANAAQIMENAQKTISLEKEKTMQDLKSQVAELAMDAARKVTGSGKSSRDDLDLYNQFLEETGERHDSEH